MQSCSPLFLYVLLFRLLSFAGGLANQPVTKVINGYQRRFTITQWRKGKGKVYQKLVAEASMGRFYKRVVRASLENEFSESAFTTLFIKCCAL